MTDRLLDQLTGARTTVTVTGYAGDDPWQTDDLIARVGQGAKRFGDGTPAEQAQAMTIVILLAEHAAGCLFSVEPASSLRLACSR